MSVKQVVMAAAGALGGAKAYIEDVFSTYLYTGNGSAQTVTNGIDFLTEGGLIWFKGRSNAQNNQLGDSSRNNFGDLLKTNLTDANTSASLFTPLTNGYTINNTYGMVDAGRTQVVWSFRKAPKFFDVVTWTGNGVNGREISHSLESTPGTIIIKCTSAAEQWFVWHRSLNTQIGCLNLTDAFGTYVQGYQAAEVFGDGSSVVQPTSTNFTVAQYGATNQSGRTYVAYLFAHDAGGFGDSGEENVISCGSYTGNGSTGQLINLGYEPQWVLIKQTDAADQWAIIDNMRGWAQSASATLCPNNANAENATFSASGATSLDPQGFRLWNANGALNQSGATFIYIAIRRGPMKTPEVGTEVFKPFAYTGTGESNKIYTTDINADAMLFFNRPSASEPPHLVDRMRSFGSRLQPSNTSAEFYETDKIKDVTNTTFNAGATASSWNISGTDYVAQIFKRAPGFFDVVCYTGDGTNPRNINHNLTVAPELIIVKRRNSTADWPVWSASFAGTNNSLNLNTTDAKAATGLFTTGSPTATTFVVAYDAYTNLSGATYVAYLFASCPGVSKVGSYTGNGTSQTIDCGFSNGARFFLVKASSSTGSWYVWDSARGIVSGNDPFLKLNATDAEDPYGDVVDPTSSGIIVNQVSPSNINTNGVTYIYLAIA